MYCNATTIDRLPLEDLLVIQPLAVRAGHSETLAGAVRFAFIELANRIRKEHKLRESLEADACQEESRES